MAMVVRLEDEEGVIKGVHHYLIQRYPLDKLEKEVYQLLKERGSLPLSAIWKNFHCHLWEVSAALRRLREKGLIEEAPPTPKAYHGFKKERL